MLTNNLGFLDREDATTPKNWDALGAGFDLVFRITRYNPLLFLGRKMINVLDGHHRDVTIG
jgi:hypothetical protein